MAVAPDRAIGQHRPASTAGRLLGRIFGVRHKFESQVTIAACRHRRTSDYQCSRIANEVDLARRTPKLRGQFKSFRRTSLVGVTRTKPDAAHTHEDMFESRRSRAGGASRSSGKYHVHRAHAHGERAGRRRVRDGDEQGAVAVVRDRDETRIATARGGEGREYARARKDLAEIPEREAHGPTPAERAPQARDSTPLFCGVLGKILASPEGNKIGLEPSSFSA